MSNKDRLNDVLASYGADPERWPAGERQALLPILQDASAEVTEAKSIDEMLSHASTVSLQVGAEERLMSRIARQPAAKIITLTPRSRQPLPWLAAVPLAASLLLGIYLGAAGILDSFLPASITEDTAALDDDDLSGIGEATDYSGDQLS